ncbi:MAG: hypothetical protein AB7H43_06960 [Acidimicrobiia bacterium]
MSDGITTCTVCGAQYLRTTLVACTDCGAPFGGQLLAEGGEEVGYDLQDWDDRQRAELVGGLAGAGIAHRWDDGELVVAEGDADRVDQLVDAVDHPDALAEEDDDGNLAADVLSALYVSSDVLQHDPAATTAVVELLEALERVPDLPPYGIDGELWGEVVARAVALADLLAEESEGEDVAVAARSLREVVRPLV